MSRKRKALSHSEVWDDSALVNSWNDALQEYKHYHSLHARGEKVEDVLHEAEEADLETSRRGNDVNEDDVEEGEVESEVSDADAADGIIENTKDSSKPVAFPDDSDHAARLVDNISSGTTVQDFQPPQMPGINIPGHLVAGLENETLKNLMMSWYYAGYYTGYYEGQRASIQQFKDSVANIGSQSRSKSEHQTGIPNNEAK